MTQLLLHEYRPEDFLAIQDPDQVWVPDTKKLAAIHATHWPAFTVKTPDDRVVFCVGIHAGWPGMGEVWALFSPLAKLYLHTAFWAATLMLYAHKTLGYRRLQTAVRIDRCDTARFIERLGFVKEGVMRCYAEGRDYALYASVGEG